MPTGCHRLMCQIMHVRMQNLSFLSRPLQVLAEKGGRLCFPKTNNTQRWCQHWSSLVYCPSTSHCFCRVMFDECSCNKSLVVRWRLSLLQCVTKMSYKPYCKGRIMSRTVMFSLGSTHRNGLFKTRQYILEPTGNPVLECFYCVHQRPLAQYCELGQGLCFTHHCFH